MKIQFHVTMLLFTDDIALVVNTRLTEMIKILIDGDGDVLTFYCQRERAN